MSVNSQLIEIIMNSQFSYFVYFCYYVNNKLTMNYLLTYD